KPDGQQAAQARVDFGFLDQAGAHGGQQVAVLDATIEVGARLQRAGHSLLGGGGELVGLVDVVDGAAIGNHIALKTPLLAQNLGEQARVGAGGLAIHAVV